MGASTQTASRSEDEQRWAAMMIKSQAGDGAIYHQLLSELSKVTEHYLRAKFGELNNLEDCVQESLLAIHHARHTYDANRAFRPWFFTIVHHKTIDVLRRNDAHKKASDQTELEKNDSTEIDLDRLIDGQRLMFALSEEQRQAITLTKYMGMTTNEASDLLGVNETTIKARLRRGLQKIKQQWLADGE